MLIIISYVNYTIIFTQKNLKSMMRKQQKKQKKESSFDEVKLMSYFDRVVSMANMFLSSILIWMTFVLIFRNNMPIVVVLSNSMEPNFVRGDLLLAKSATGKEIFPNGEICAYNVRTSPIPIVHRMIETHVVGKQELILTKGDNNKVPDNWLYSGEEFYINSAVETHLVAIIPKLAWFSILVKEKRWCSVIFILVMTIQSFRNPDDG